MGATLEEIEREAMALSEQDRVRLADKLWDSVAGRRDLEVVMTPELQRLLDEGLENLDQGKTTDELRRRK
jgi:putative addiction module component (TIGR02574 family)